MSPEQVLPPKTIERAGINIEMAHVEAFRVLLFAYTQPIGGRSKLNYIVGDS